MYRQSWDTINRPAYANKKWSDQQQTALDLIDKGVSYDDETAKRESYRFLHVKGCPGSGKSAVLLEGAIRCAKLTVVIICPTGALGTALKLLLPEFDGVDRIHVDTIHGILKYTRAKDRAIASWAPPSASAAWLGAHATGHAHAPRPCPAAATRAASASRLSQRRPAPAATPE